MMQHRVEPRSIKMSQKCIIVKKKKSKLTEALFPFLTTSVTWCHHDTTTEHLLSALVNAACLSVQWGHYIPLTPHCRPQACFLNTMCIHSVFFCLDSLSLFMFSFSLLISKSQSYIPELETLLSERVRAFVDWLQDNRAFSSSIHVVK